MHRRDSHLGCLVPEEFDCLRKPLGCDAVPVQKCAFVFEVVTSLLYFLPPFFNTAPSFADQKAVKSPDRPCRERPGAYGFTVISDACAPKYV
ncbi:hypothetical protein GCM10009756_18780 [Pseudokineococcus marinus]